MGSGWKCLLGPEKSLPIRKRRVHTGPQVAYVFINSFSPYRQSYEIDAIMSILQMRKLRLGLGNLSKAKRLLSDRVRITIWSVCLQNLVF